MKLLKKEKENNKCKKSQLIFIGSFFMIIVGIGIYGNIIYKDYVINKDEQNKIDDFIDDQKKNELKQTNKETEENTNVANSIVSSENIEKYVAVIEIPKIKLRKGIYSKSSSKNNVNINIEILKESDMPDKVNGNFILASHSGTSRISYFKNLHKLEKDDEVYIYYSGKKYVYKLVNYYDIEKTGIATITRNGEKTTLTLITCKRHTNKQTIFIFELVKDGDL